MNSMVNRHTDYEFDSPNAFPLQIYSVCSYDSPGTVIIFNHFDFTKASEKLGNRYGTEKDVERLTILFRKINYTVHCHNDLTSNGIKEKLNEHVSSTDWDHSGSIVLIVLTHGEENGMLWSSDKLYHCSQLWDPILKCDKLKDKFKFIILQACRGKRREKKFEFKNLEKLNPQQSTHDDLTSSDASTKKKTPKSVAEVTYKTLPNTANNLIIAHSTVEGCDSVRNIEKGTWYIQLLSGNLGSYWANPRDPGVDLLDVLTATNMELIDETDRDDISEGQTASFTSYLSHTITYSVCNKYSAVASSYANIKPYGGRAYIYYDKNHIKEAQEFSETMKMLYMRPILHEIDHGETALIDMCKISHKNEFQHENCIIFAVFTTCESVINNNVPLKEIYNNFSAEKCPSLAAKLKWFCFFDMKYSTSELDSAMDSEVLRPNYVTNHSDFLIVRGHSKEFLVSLNCELRRTLRNPSYNLCQILTTAMRHESNNDQQYTSNFESTLQSFFCFFPGKAELPISMLHEGNILPSHYKYDTFLYLPDRNFTGRDAELQMLISETSSKTPGKKVIRVSGMSGIGKTQLVLVFKRYFSWLFNNTIWMNAETEKDLKENFSEVAEELGIFSKDKIPINTKILVSAVYQYFQTNERTLFVFDNYTDECIKYLPDNVGTSEIYHIVTTNVSNISEDTISLNNFTTEETREFIGKILDLSNSTDNEIEKLAEIIGNFPLVLHLSVSSILEHQKLDPNYTITQFIQEFTAEPETIINKTEISEDTKRQPYSSYYDKTFYKLCMLKVTKIKENKLALLILYIICYCESDNIPLNIFRLLQNHDDNNEKQKRLIDMRNKSAVHILINESLINRQYGVGNIHRLVQECIKNIIRDQNKEFKVIKKALDLIKCLLNYNEEFKEFENHALKIYKLALENISEFENHIETANKIAREISKYKTNQAIDFLKVCEEKIELKYGINSEYSISIKIELINLLVDRKRYEEAFNIQENIVTIMEDKNLQDTSEYMKCLKEKAKILQLLQRYEEAQIMINSILQWYNNSKSTNRNEIIITEKQLASLLIDKGQLKESLQLLQNILEYENKSYPENDVRKIETLMLIANIHEKNPNTECEAIELHVEILEKLIEFDTLDHIKISEIQLKLDSIINTINTRDHTKHAKINQDFYEKFQETSKLLGKGHIKTIIVQTIAINCMKYCKNQLWQALDLIDNLIETCKNKIEEDHERILQSKLIKAQILRLLHRKKDSIKLYEHLYEIYEVKHGCNYSTTELISKELESTKMDEDSEQEIVLSYETMLYEKRDIVRDEIYEELFSFSRQANIKLEQDKYTEAIVIYDKILEIEEKYFPVNDICNLITKYNKLQADKNVDMYKENLVKLYNLAQETLGNEHEFVLLIKKLVK